MPTKTRYLHSSVCIPKICHFFLPPTSYFSVLRSRSSSSFLNCNIRSGSDIVLPTATEFAVCTRGCFGCAVWSTCHHTTVLYVLWPPLIPEASFYIYTNRMSNQQRYPKLKTSRENKKATATKTENGCQSPGASGHDRPGQSICLKPKMKLILQKQLPSIRCSLV